MSSAVAYFANTLLITWQKLKPVGRFRFTTEASLFKQTNTYVYLTQPTSITLINVSFQLKRHCNVLNDFFLLWLAEGKTSQSIVIKDTTVRLNFQYYVTSHTSFPISYFRSQTVAVFVLNYRGIISQVTAMMLHSNLTP